MSRDWQKIANDLSGPASCLKEEKYRERERERNYVSELGKRESEKEREREQETGKTV